MIFVDLLLLWVSMTRQFWECCYSHFIYNVKVKRNEIFQCSIVKIKVLSVLSTIAVFKILLQAENKKLNAVNFDQNSAEICLQMMLSWLRVISVLKNF